MLGDVRFWKSGCSHGDLKEAGEAAGDAVDCFEGEVVPGAEIADVPPKVRLFAVAAVIFQLGAEVNGRVWSSEILGEAQYWVIVTMVLEFLRNDWWSTLLKRDWWWNERRCPW